MKNITESLSKKIIPTVVDTILRSNLLAGRMGFGKLKYKGLTVSQPAQFEIGENCLIFRDGETLRETGRLVWEKGEIRFEGNAAPSAKKFLETLKNYISLEKIWK